MAVEGIIRPVDLSSSPLTAPSPPPFILFIPFGVVGLWIFYATIRFSAWETNY
jgi:hypothetical protein